MPYVKNSNLRSFTFFLLWIARLNSSIEIFSSENMIFFHHLSYRFELELESSLQNEGLRGINIYFDQFYSSRKCIGGKRKKLSIFSSQTDQSTKKREHNLSKTVETFKVKLLWLVLCNSGIPANVYLLRQRNPSYISMIVMIGECSLWLWLVSTCQTEKIPILESHFLMHFSRVSDPFYNKLK